MPALRDDPPPVRTFNGIEYIGEPKRDGWLWNGGLIGGTVWTRPGAPRRTFDRTAYQAQQWALREYRECRQYAQAFEDGLATCGKEYKLAFAEELAACASRQREELVAVKLRAVLRPKHTARR
jgi:hypothetical protein